MTYLFGNRKTWVPPYVVRRIEDLDRDVFRRTGTSKSHLVIYTRVREGRRVIYSALCLTESVHCVTLDFCGAQQTWQRKEYVSCRINRVNLVESNTKGKERDLHSIQLEWITFQFPQFTYYLRKGQVHVTPDNPKGGFPSYPRLIPTLSPLSYVTWSFYTHCTTNLPFMW